MSRLIHHLTIPLLAWSLVFLAVAVPAQDLPRRITNRWGMEFILVPSGRYTVCHGPEGDEAGPGFADLNAFYLQVTEVTRAQWKALGVDNRFEPLSDEKAAFPAHGLSHGDALNLVGKINGLSGRRLYRLPGEAEWEAACRAGGDSLALTPEKLAQVAWVRADSQGRPHQVAGKLPNKLGFFDLLGNLYEWCRESYSPSSCPGLLVGDPNGPTRGLYRVLRGGSYNSTPATARCGWRFFYEPTARHPENGCRLVRAAVPLSAREK